MRELTLGRATDARVALGVLVSVLGSAAPAAAAPFFTEIMWNPANTSSADTGYEWVELYNPDTAAVDLTGHKVRVRQTAGTLSSSEFPLPAGTSLPPAGYLVLAKDARINGQTSCAVASVAYGSALTFYNSSSPVVELLDGANAVVDSVPYTAAGYPAVEGRAATVTDVGTGNDVAANWRSSDCIYATAPATEYGTPNGVDTACGDTTGPNPICLPVPDAGPPVDAGADGGATLDAGATDAAVVTDPGVFISEIFFDPTPSADNNLEWLELYNPTSADVALTGYKLRTELTRVFPIPAGAVVTAGGYLLITETANLGGMLGCDVSALAWDDAITLLNSSGAYVELLDGTNTVVDRVQYVGGGFPAAAPGHALAVVNISLGNNSAANWAAATCIYASKDYGAGPVPDHGTPGAPNQDCAGLPDAGVPAPACLPVADAGSSSGGSSSGNQDAGAPRDAGGLLIPLDASPGPNSPPTLQVTLPAADSSQSPVTVDWSAVDPDGDVVTVSVLKAVASGTDLAGEEVLSGLGATGPASWDTTGVTPGVYRLLVVADDGHGHVVSQPAPGRVEVGGAGDNALSFLEPGGGTTATELLTIKLSVASPDGLVSVHYDTDSSGLDGTAIAGGLRPRLGTVEVTWDVATVAPGDYWLYAVLEGAGPNRSAYVGPVTVPKRGCGCGRSSSAAPPQGALVLGAAAVMWWAFRRTHRRRPVSGE
ncbi:MAG: lamin tail domain-containing protein [Deltaproteobacteria bacterium]|nr:lamin tail domain-containing protein [Deltaproteobacteria bacterium]